MGSTGPGHEPVRLRRVSSRGLRLPLAAPYRSAKGVATEVAMVYTEVVTDDSTIGRSLVRVAAPSLVDPLCKAVEAAAVLLESSRTIDGHLLALKPSNAEVLPAVTAALELALWDNRSQHHDLALARLFGHRPKAIAAYAGIGLAEPAETAAAMQQVLAAGHRAVKLKVGHPDLAGDLAAIQAVRDVAGSSAVDVMVDYNQQLSVQEALERGAVLDGEDLRWIEEPVAATDFVGQAEVARRLRTPVQAGESWWHREQLDEALQLQAVDKVMLDPAKLGVTGWLEAAQDVAAAGLRISSHLSPHVCVQLMSCVEHAELLELSPWWDPFLGALPIADGTTAAPDEPFRWDVDAIRSRLTTDRLSGG